MPLTDLRNACAQTYDACIVGSGPAGTAAALGLSEAGHKVLLIDAGAQTPSVGPQATRSIETTHAALSDTNCRAFGGTSWLWGGRIMPFSTAEFSADNWPVDHASYATHLDEAATFLGGSPLERAFITPDQSNSFDLDAIEMLGPDGPVSKRHEARLMGDQGPDILLSTTVVDLDFEQTQDGQTRCAAVKLRPTTGTGTEKIAAKTTIIASGGVETARLLLATKARNNNVLGHLEALGVGYTGHLTGSISTITFPRNQDTRTFGWRERKAGGFQRRVFRSTAAAVADDANMFFWARNWPTEDAQHGSGILSAKYLASRLKPQPKLRPSNGPGAPEVVQNSKLAPHFRNLAKDAPTSLRAIPDFLRARANKDRRQLDHLIPNGRNCFKLCYHAEQKRSDDNRIEITGPVNMDELPDIHITYDYGNADIEGVVLGHQRLEADLAVSGLAKLTYETDPGDLRNDIRSKALDGYHQIGTARMGKNSADSVVDSDCKVHGIEGLYLAGSSIFPTSGAVPPTQSIVAFALRLSQHLSKRLS